MIDMFYSKCLTEYGAKLAIEALGLSPGKDKKK